MYLDYTQDLDNFVRRVKFYLADASITYLEAYTRGYEDKEAYQLGYLLFSALQVLSYLREDEGNEQAIGLVISHVLTLIDLEGQGLEPYNLYYRPTHSTTQSAVLYDGQSLVGNATGPIQVGVGTYTKPITLPSVYPADQPLTPYTPF